MELKKIEDRTDSIRKQHNDFINKIYADTDDKKRFNYNAVSQVWFFKRLAEIELYMMEMDFEKMKSKKNQEQ